MITARLTLDPNDRRVVAARAAEKELFDFYGLRPKEHYVLLPDEGIKVRVLEIGTGDPIVVVPGNTGDVFPLAPLLAELPRRRIIAINRPGGGLSEGMDHHSVDIRSFAVKTLDTVMEHFQLRQADVVAHSMGAHWSLWLAMDHPDRVRRLVLLGNPGNVMKGKPPFLIRLLSRPLLAKGLLRLLMPANKDKALRPLRTMGHSARSLDSQPKALSHAYYYFRRLPHYEISATTLLQNAAPNIDAAQLQMLSQPVTLLLGDKDTFASISTGEAIAAALPHGTLQVIKNAGHLPWLESPEECGRRIMDFLTPH